MFVFCHERNTLHVLILDDDPLILRSLKRILNSASIVLEGGQAVDLEIHAFDHPEVALDFLKTHPVDLIISDQIMPRLTGLVFLKYAMMYSPQSIAILLTGEYDFDVAMAAINSNTIFRYITKPWNNKALLETITLALTAFRDKQDQQKHTQQIEAQNRTLSQHVTHLETRLEQYSTTSNKVARTILTNENEAVDGIMGLMLSLMELGHEQILEHSKNTLLRVHQFGEFLKIHPNLLSELVHAANFHWLGLVNAPDAMFSKRPAHFDVDERALWSFHPLLSQQVLQNVPALTSVGQIIVNYLNPPPTMLPIRSLDELSIECDTFSPDILTVASCILHICSAFEREYYLLSLDRSMIHAAKLSAAVLYLKTQGEHIFDSDLLEQFSRYIEFACNAETTEKRLNSVMEICTGMVISRPLATPGGTPLIAAGTEVTDTLIERLIFLEDTFDAWIDGLYVWV